MTLGIGCARVEFGRSSGACAWREPPRIRARVTADGLPQRRSGDGAARRRDSDRRLGGGRCAEAMHGRGSEGSPPPISQWGVLRRDWGSLRGGAASEAGEESVAPIDLAAGRRRYERHQRRGSPHQAHSGEHCAMELKTPAPGGRRRHRGSASSHLAFSSLLYHPHGFLAAVLLRRRRLRRLLVSDADVGRFIGKGGSAVTAMESTSGTHVKLSRRGQLLPGTDCRVLLVSGLFHQVMDAAELILQKLVY